MNAEAGPSRTLRQHFEALLGNISPERVERLCAIVIDGQTLGSYPTGIHRDREAEKRFEEMQWAAVALVGCDVDREIVELRSPEPRLGEATADFEAIVRSGDGVRLEVARLVFRVEREQTEYFASIGGDANALLNRDDFAEKGTFLYRVYDPTRTRIGRDEVHLAVPELARFVRTTPGLLQNPNRLIAVKDERNYPTLSRLQVSVFHNGVSGQTHLMWDPLIEPLDTAGAVKVFRDLLEGKAQKVPGYSDNGAVPVWLVIGVYSITQKYIALSTVQALASMDSIDPRPFTRVLVGCTTAGVTFTVANQRPSYTSLSSTG